jgi:hypothetical protein
MIVIASSRYVLSTHKFADQSTLMPLSWLIPITVRRHQGGVAGDAA